MRQRIILATIWLLCPATGLSSDEATHSLSTKELVQGILARSEAVFNGELEYHEETGFPNQKIEAADYKATFSGSSWRLSSRQHAADLPVHVSRKARERGVAATPPPCYAEFVILSHNGKSVQFTNNPQHDGSLSPAAAIGQEKSVNDSDPSPPVFAGSFWHQCTKRFVQDHMSQAERKGSTEISGAKAEILEWKVLQSDRSRAFQSFNQLTKKGGILRVFVLPQMGYVLPRVECLSPDEKLAKLFDCSDFHECTPGIFFPKKLGVQYHDSQGPGFYTKYEITSIKRINQAIPDRDFVIQLPLGTVVSDGRLGKGAIIFKLDEDAGIPTELGDVIAVQSPSFWGRNWQTGLIVGASLGLPIVASYYAFRRFKPRRTRT